MTDYERVVQINIISFTAAGMRLAEQVAERLTAPWPGGKEKNRSGLAAFSHTSCQFALYTKYKGAVRQTASLAEHSAGVGQRKTTYLTRELTDWVGGCFHRGEPLLLVGACGIAVRAIAPFVRDKLTDIPVLVMDEKGAYVIPVLSGHYGGANELARLIADAVGAAPVITTATDVNRLFAVDVFARKNNLSIANRQAIASVSAKILEGTITMQICGAYAGEVPREVALVEGIRGALPGVTAEMSVKTGRAEETKASLPDVLVAPQQLYGAKSNGQMLHLIPRVLVLGAGCRKGKDPDEWEKFVCQQLERWKIPLEAVKALATIDRKRGETALRRFADKYRLQFLTFSAEHLSQAEGDFAASAFVKQQVGVDNVCERAAVLGAGQNARLLEPKTACGGMTLAVAVCDWQVVFDKEDSR